MATHPVIAALDEALEAGAHGSSTARALLQNYQDWKADIVAELDRHEQKQARRAQEAPVNVGDSDDGRPEPDDDGPADSDDE